MGAFRCVASTSRQGRYVLDPDRGRRLRRASFDAQCDARTASTRRVRTASSTDDDGAQRRRRAHRPTARVEPSRRRCPPDHRHRRAPRAGADAHRIGVARRTTSDLGRASRLGDRAAHARRARSQPEGPSSWHGHGRRPLRGPPRSPHLDGGSRAARGQLEGPPPRRRHAGRRAGALLRAARGGPRRADRHHPRGTTARGRHRRAPRTTRNPSTRRPARLDPRRAPGDGTGPQQQPARR